MLTQRSLREQVAFYLFLAILGGLAFWLIRDYLDIIAFSFVAVIVLKPLYDVLLRWMRGRKAFAVILTFVAFFLAIIIPTWIALRIIGGQLSQMDEQLQSGVQIPALDQLQLSSAAQEQIKQAARQVAAWLAAFVVSLGLSIPDLVSRAFIFFGIVGALLPGYDAFVARIKRLSPLDDQIDTMFLRRLRLTIWAMFIAIFVIAVLDGLVTGLLMWLGGVPYSAVWTLIAIVASMLPLGASLVALPIGIIELLNGNTTGAIIILAGYLLIVSNVDTVLRPRLQPKEADLSFALALISALAGYTLFGFFGVIYGPVLMVMFLTAVDVYEQFYAGDTPPPAPVPPAEAAGIISDDTAVRGAAPVVTKPS